MGQNHCLKAYKKQKKKIFPGCPFKRNTLNRLVRDRYSSSSRQSGFRKQGGCVGSPIDSVDVFHYLRDPCFCPYSHTGCGIRISTWLTLSHLCPKHISCCVEKFRSEKSPTIIRKKTKKFKKITPSHLNIITFHFFEFPQTSQPFASGIIF